MIETFTSLLHGFSIALTPLNLLWGFIGTMLGTFIGVLPGVGPALTVAMLMPLTIKLDPTGALIMFAGIYYGAMYGGSTTTILLNTPRRIGIHRHRAGRKFNGEKWPCRPGAGDLRHRLLRLPAPSQPFSSPFLRPSSSRSRSNSARRNISP